MCKINHLFIALIEVGFGFDQHLHHFGVTQRSSAPNEALILYIAMGNNTLYQPQIITRTIEQTEMQNHAPF